MWLPVSLSFCLCLSVCPSVPLSGRGVKTLQEVRYKGTKYKEEILRALQGIDQQAAAEEEQEQGGGQGGGRVKQGLERSLEHRDYVWKRKETHDVSDE
jgi:hypothetical protein